MHLVPHVFSRPRTDMTLLNICMLESFQQMIGWYPVAPVGVASAVQAYRQASLSACLALHAE